MKNIFFCIACVLSLAANAQTIINKTFPAKAGQQVTLKFDYPVVKVSTWNKNEIAVTARVSINGGENDSAFVLEGKSVNDGWVISDQIVGIDKMPRRYTVVINGQKKIYKSKEEFRTASRETGVQSSYEGMDIDIVVEIKIPEQCTADIKSVYGIVEMSDFNAPATVDATYGGIDATVAVAATGKLKATTSYGQIYSNLDAKISDHAERDFFNSITFEPGKGPSLSLTSTYGKIYLRRPM